MTEVLNRLAFHANNSPDQIAYTIKNNNITYGELYLKSCTYAEYLKRQGCGPVMLVGHKEIEFFIGIFACMIAQRAYIPIDISIPKERIQKIISSTGTDLIISSDSDFSLSGEKVLRLANLNKFANNSIHTSDNSTAYIIFTSGSTGEPKGVPISYENLDNFAAWISGIEPLNQYKNITVLNQALFSFDLSVADIYYAIFNGHTLAALDRQDIAGFDTVFATISEKKPSVMVVTPTFAKLCLTDKDFCHEHFPFIKCIYFCGEVLENSTVKKLFSRFPNIKIINAYGPTEATSAVSAILITDNMANDYSPLPVGEIGKFATDIEIYDDEIVLKGKSVFSGYTNSLAGGHFVENGVNCYKTGDNGKIENGFLYCLGRRDRQVKLNGYRVELDEIESRIDEVEGVTACAVVPLYSQSGKLRKISAFVCGNTDANNIRNDLRQSLPSYMIPTKIDIVDKLSINRNGKIDRKALARNEKY